VSRIEQDIEELRTKFANRLVVSALPSGAHLIEIRDYELVPGWSLPKVTILFLAPPAFPAAQPDCFWVEPTGIRLANGGTPQNSNDANPIPEVGNRGTWFSWHLQAWNPNSGTLKSYFGVIEKRLSPPR
jgi:hypothetical protein